MRNIYFGDSRLLIQHHIKNIENTGPNPYSIVWFLLRDLRKIAGITIESAALGRADICIKAMIRFYLDNINDKLELGDRCIIIYDEYCKIIRSKQDKEP